MKITATLAWLVLFAVAPLHAADNAGWFDRPVDTDAPPPGFLKTVETLQSHKVMRGRFHQRKNLAVLDKPFLSEGRFVFSREKGLLWKVSRPLHSTYVITADGIKTVESGSGEDEPASLGSSIAHDVGALFSSILSADVDQLSKHFEIHYRTPDNRWEIGLKPDSRLINEMIRHIIFSGRDHIETIVIDESNGDSTQIRFSGVETADRIDSTEAGLFERAH